jgi:hypothetical protein
MTTFSEGGNACQTLRLDHAEGTVIGAQHALPLVVPTVPSTASKSGAIDTGATRNISTTGSGSRHHAPLCQTRSAQTADNPRASLTIHNHTEATANCSGVAISGSHAASPVTTARPRLTMADSVAMRSHVGITTNDNSETNNNSDTSATTSRLGVEGGCPKKCQTPAYRRRWHTREGLRALCCSYRATT